VFKIDISSAYAIPELKILSREFIYSRGKSENLQITDEFEFASPHLFETALITRGKWKQLSSDQLLIEGKTEKLLVNIISPQGAFTIVSEEISEENGEPYSRLGLRLVNPVKFGKFVVEFVPVERVKTNKP
jgi:hypothetical protein